MKKIRYCLLMFLVLLPGISTSSDAAKIAKKANSQLGKWEYLFRANPRASGKKTLPKNSPLQSLEEFKITGAHQKDANRLNEVICDGQWGTSQGVLMQLSGRAAAVKLGRAKDFELEIGVQAEGTGGWFLLFGFEDGHGYGVYNVTLRTSGSQWFVTEFRNNKGVVETDRKLVNYECKGKESLKLRVAEGKASMIVGNKIILDNIELTASHEGDIILGTYNTQYGPKPVKVFGIRIRAAK